MEPTIDHIQITVKDMASAIAFYDAFLPLLGFSLRAKATATIEKHDFHVVEYSHPRLSFAITSPRTAFRGDDVHRRKPGSLFKDPDGIKHEIVTHDPAGGAAG